MAELEFILPNILLLCSVINTLRHNFKEIEPQTGSRLLQHALETQIIGFVGAHVGGSNDATYTTPGTTDLTNRTVALTVSLANILRPFQITVITQVLVIFKIDCPVFRIFHPRYVEIISTYRLTHIIRQTPGPNTPDLPWKADTDDWTENYENDKALRNQGYMKGPHYFTECNGQGNSTLRNRGGAYATFRRIVTTADLRADKTYYLRIKSALKKYDAELVLDYFEFAPSYVYNGATREDIW